MLEIYSIGDGDFVAATLNAVAMVMDDSGPAGMGDLVKTGFAIGTLLLLFSYFKQQRVQLHQMLIPFIIYAGFFSEKTDVIVEDVQSGQTQTVGNIPIGLATMASILSKMGYYTGDYFEQAFSTPSMIDMGASTDLGSPWAISCFCRSLICSCNLAISWRIAELLCM